MELHQLRCFVAVAEELHFGRAARRLEMLPASLGRHIRLLEEALGIQLLLRTTRSVALTEDGSTLLDEARRLLDRAEQLHQSFLDRARRKTAALRLGAIDTAAAGLFPLLLHDFRDRRPGVAVELVEDKTIRLLPRLLSGRLDLALVRPPEHPDTRIEFLPLFHERAVVAVPTQHRLSHRARLGIRALVGEPLIVPDRRSRPHSHDLTMKLFAEAGARPTISQIAGEKQTIVNLVAAGLGLAIVPRWASRWPVPGVRFVPLRLGEAGDLKILPLAAAWLRGSRDPVRDAMLAVLRANLASYAAKA